MNDNHVGVMLENIESQIQLLAESMAEVPGDVRKLKDDISILSQDMKTVKAAVTDTSVQVASQAQRLSAIETS